MVVVVELLAARVVVALLGVGLFQPQLALSVLAVLLVQTLLVVTHAMDTSLQVVGLVQTLLLTVLVVLVVEEVAATQELLA